MVGNGDPKCAVWRPKPQQNAKALRSFNDAMDDIRTVLEFRLGHALSVEYIRNAGRKVTVELRKLLLDGAPLVHRVLERPRFHPLRDRNDLTGDIYENSSTIRVAPGTEEGPQSKIFAEHKWSVAIHPLHGLRFSSPAKRWVFGPLFDPKAQPLALGAWLNQRLFQVDQRVYSLGDTLKYVANKEAVHVDLLKNEQSRDMEHVHFGHTTYPQLIAVLAASYLLERYRTSRTENTELWGQFVGMSGKAAPEYKIICGGEFQASEIYSPGFPDEFHDTGIQVPTPGRVWKPVKIWEHAIVRP